jgi:hypothetical protein
MPQWGQTSFATEFRVAMAGLPGWRSLGMGLPALLFAISAILASAPSKSEFVSERFWMQRTRPLSPLQLASVDNNIVRAS